LGLLTETEIANFTVSVNCLGKWHKKSRIALME
jgi:hypothetical protein